MRPFDPGSYNQDVKAILWDLNGVLVDDHRMQQRAWEVVLPRDLDLPPDWFAAQFLGRRAAVALADVLPDVSPSDRSVLLGEYHQHYRELCLRDLPEVPGARELLLAAHARRLRQAVVSSAHPDQLQLVLDQLQIQWLFGSVVDATRVQEGKPSPEGYLLAARELSVEPSQCWVIEDTPVGIQAARAAGCRCLAVTTSLPAQALSEADLVTGQLSPVLLRQMLTTPSRLI